MKKLFFILVITSLTACQLIQKKAVVPPLAYNASKPYDGNKGKINQVDIYSSYILTDGNEEETMTDPSLYQTLLYDSYGQIREGLNYNDKGEPIYAWKSEFDPSGVLIRSESFSMLSKDSLINVQERVWLSEDKIVWLSYVQNKPYERDSMILYMHPQEKLDSLVTMDRQLKIIKHYDDNNNLISVNRIFEGNSSLKEKYNYDVQNRRIFSFVQFGSNTNKTHIQYTKLDSLGNWIEKEDRSDVIPRVYTRKIIYDEENKF